MIAGFLFFWITQTQAANIPGIDGNRLSDLVGKVRSCVTLPVCSEGTGTRRLFPLKSKCSQVRVVRPGAARIQMGGISYEAVLKVSENSEAEPSDEVMDVLIRDLSGPGETLVPGVRAHGDVLLGLLGGHDQGLPEVRMKRASCSALRR